MNLVIGILLFGLGVITFFAWLSDLVPFFKGVVVFSLLGWGALAIVIGASKLRARAQFQRAKNDAPSPAESESEGASSEA